MAEQQKIQERLKKRITLENDSGASDNDNDNDNDTDFQNMGLSIVSQ